MLTNVKKKIPWSTHEDEVEHEVEHEDEVDVDALSWWYRFHTKLRWQFLTI